MYVYAHALEATAPTVSMGLATDLMHRDKKVNQSHYRPGQAQRVLRNLRFTDFVTTA